VRASRVPVPLSTRSEIERTYESRVDELGCVNPEFNELPVGQPTFRVFAQLKGG
jgi:hypothetical protein